MANESLDKLKQMENEFIDAVLKMNEKKIDPSWISARASQYVLYAETKKGELDNIKNKLEGINLKNEVGQKITQIENYLTILSQIKQKARAKAPRGDGYEQLDLKKLIDAIFEDHRDRVNPEQPRQPPPHQNLSEDAGTKKKLPPLPSQPKRLGPSQRYLPPPLPPAPKETKGGGKRRRKKRRTKRKKRKSKKRKSKKRKTKRKRKSKRKSKRR